MAEPVTVRSKDGSVMKLVIYDGRYYVAHFVGNVKDHLAAIEKMEVREDDTFVLTYQKSGTHWAYNLAGMLRTAKTTYQGSPIFLDFTDIETINNLPSPRLLASHLTFDFMPKQLREGKGRVLTVLRNPKDVMSSLYTFGKKLDHPDFYDRYQFSWDGLLEFFMEGKIFYGTWFDYVHSWDKVRREHKENNILYFIYEDMKQDLLPHVNKLAAFLGSSCEQDFLNKVTEKCTFKNMVIDATKAYTPSEQWKTISTNQQLPIYRKGEVGDWKNYFTVAQNEHFDEVYEEKMKNSMFSFRFV